MMWSDDLISPPSTRSPAPSISFDDLIPAAAPATGTPPPSAPPAPAPAGSSISFDDLIPAAPAEGPSSTRRRTRGTSAARRRIDDRQAQRETETDEHKGMKRRRMDPAPLPPAPSNDRPIGPWLDKVFAPLGAGIANLPDNLGNMNDWLNMTFYTPVDAVLGTSYREDAWKRMVTRQERISERGQVAIDESGPVWGQMGSALGNELPMLPLQFTGARVAQIGAATQTAALKRAMAASATLGGTRSAAAEFASDTLEDIRKGVDPAQAAKQNYPLSIAKGLGTAASIAAFGPTGVESIFRTSGAKGVVGKLVEVLKGAGMEAAQEGADEGQQILLDLMARREVTLKEAAQRIGMGLALGGIMGGGVAGYHAAYTAVAEATLDRMAGYKPTPAPEAPESPAPPAIPGDRMEGGLEFKPAQKQVTRDELLSEIEKMRTGMEKIASEPGAKLTEEQSRLLELFQTGSPEQIAAEFQIEILPAPVTSPASRDVMPAGESLVGNAGRIHEVPSSSIVLRPKLMQFKEITNQQTGENAKDQLEGEWDYRKAGVVLLWEPANPPQYGMTEGQKYIVANGHHRVAFGNRLDIPAHNAQIIREADGHSAEAAMIMAAEINIADGKGTIYDQAKFIRNTRAVFGEDQARAQAVQIGPRGRRAATIALQTSDNLYTAFLNEQITPEHTAAIAAAAPNNDGAQRVGMRAAAKGNAPASAANLARLATIQSQGETLVAGDLFGQSDAAFLAMDRIDAAANAVAATLQERVTAAQSAAKRPEIAAKMGVDVKDTTAVQSAVARLKAELDKWKHYPSHPEILARLRAGDADPEAIAEAAMLGETTPPAPPTIAQTGEGKLFPESDLPFNLTGQADTSAEAIAAAEAQAAAAEAARIQAEQQTRLFEEMVALPGAQRVMVNGLQAVLYPPSSSANRIAESIAGYHGTPHKIDPATGFRLDRIGTGEGAQAYGWGLYFGEKRETGQQYQRNLAALSWKTQNDGSDESRRAKSMLAYYKTKDAAIRQVQSDLNDGYLKQEEAELLRFHIENATGTESGNLYTVELDVETDQLLDWDKPLGEQSEKVRDAFNSWLSNDIEAFNAAMQMTGQQWYSQGNDGQSGAKRRSEFLLSIGIPGIRYLDEGSRGRTDWTARHPQGGENTFPNERQARDFVQRNPEFTLIAPDQTHNYVIFDESKIRITAENDIPVKTLNKALVDKIGEVQLREEQPQVSYENKKQIIFDFAASIYGQESGPAARRTLQGRIGPGPTIIRDAIAEEVKSTLKVGFVGKTVRNIWELAAKAQALRNPRFETFYLLATKRLPNGRTKILKASAVTSRCPCSAELFIDGMKWDEGVADYVKWLGGVEGADGFYMLHNHPSGDVSPSRNDRSITARLATDLAPHGYKFNGHVVINHRRVAFIKADGTDTIAEIPEKMVAKKFRGDDPFAPPEELKNLPNILGVEQAIYAGKWFQMQQENPKSLVGLMVGSQGNIVSAMVGTANHFLNIWHKGLVDYGRSQGGISLYLHGKAETQADAIKLIEALMPLNDQDMLGDAVIMLADGTHISAIEAGLFRYPDRFFGVEKKTIGVRVQEDTRQPGDAKAAGEPLPPGENLPDWVKQKPETRWGRRIVERIRRMGAKGPTYREIIDSVNKAVGVEVRRSKSQTTRRNPAHYRPRGHLVFTRDPNRADFAFHEAGHGLMEILLDRAQGEIHAINAALRQIANMPNSMASADNAHEGMAEWLRRRIQDPASVESSPATAVIEKTLAEVAPKIATEIRDATRAAAAFNALPVADRWALLARGHEQTWSWSGMWDVLTRGTQSAMQASFRSGMPIYRLDRQMYREIYRGLRREGMEAQAAHKAARDHRRLTSELVQDYNLLLSVGPEAQKALSGTDAMRGVRTLGADRNMVMILNKTWKEIADAIPTRHWRQFEEAGWALESLNRWQSDKLEYPGMRMGITPADLAAIVAKARQDVPAFDHHFSEVQSYFDALLDAKDFAGLKKRGEVDKMRRREMYWPLPRAMDATHPGIRAAANAAEIDAGDRRAKGGNAPIRNLHQVATERTRQTYMAIYANRLGLDMRDNMARIAADPNMPMEARTLAGRVLTPLKLPNSVVAKLTKEEAQTAVYDAVVAQRAEDLGISQEEVRSMFEPEDLLLSWDFFDVWRPTKPNDARVVSLLDGGERKFYQVQDDAMWMLFARPQDAGTFGKFWQWLVAPTSRNVQRIITGSPEFGLIRNLPGDIFNQTILNPDNVGWIPGGATAVGLFNKFAAKYPIAFQEGMLLSRMEPSKFEMENKLKRNAVFQFLAEGLYVSHHENPAVRLLANVFNPNNLLFPAFKLADLYNLIRGGRIISPMTESSTREGAAVAVKMRGGSDAEALYKYWQTTGTFNEHGANPAVTAMLRGAIFVNPMVQAASGAFDNLTDPDPAVRAKIWTRLMVVVPAAFTAAASIRYMLMDEEDKDRERERPIESRMDSYDVAGMRFRFPYGPEGTIGTFAYNATMDGLLDMPGRTGPKEAWALLRRIAGVDSPLQLLGPLFMSVTEAQMNYSTFRQAHIVSPWQVGLDPKEQYRTTTPEFYRRLGEWANYSPDKIQYIVQQGMARQIDEIIGMLDRVETGRPMQEKADLPFVGRLFLRDPNGFSSQSVRDLGDVQDRYRLLQSRISSSGWKTTLDLPDEMLSPDMRALKTQLRALDTLRDSRRDLEVLAQEAKAARLGRDWDTEHNMRRVMVFSAQAALAANPDAVERVRYAMDLLREIGDAPPETKEFDYRERNRLGPAPTAPTAPTSPAVAFDDLIPAGR